MGHEEITVPSTPVVEPVAELLTMPDKFGGDEQKMFAAYAALEAKQGAAPVVEPVVTPTVEPVVADVPALTIQNYQDTWALQGGKLEDAQWQTISDQTGIDLATLRDYEANTLKSQEVAQTAEQDTNDAVVFGAAGGEAQYEKMIQWGGSNLTEAEIGVMNEMMNNPILAAAGVKQLRDRYEAVNGVEANVSTLNTAMNPVSQAETFNSKEEVQAAFADPRYQTDPAYRRKLEQKLTLNMKAI